jgi:hypothetical protein
LLVIALLFVAGDTAARSFAGGEIEDQLASALDLGDEPQVDIGGFPFLWEVLRGRFDEVTISSDQVATKEIDLTDVSLTLSDVRFSAAKAVGGRLRKLEVDSARGRAVISAPALQRALSSLPTGALPLIPEGTLDIEGNELNLGVARVPLPVLVDEMQYESAEVINGAVHLIFRLDKTTLQL